MLSNLPNSVIHHILSFLDDKSVVRTSTLSKQWKCTWIQGSTLLFNNTRFRSNSSFETYIHKVLSLRSPTNLHKLSLIAYLEPKQVDYNVFVDAVRYAFAHGVERLEIHLESFFWEESYYSFFYLFASTISQHRSLKFLSLAGFIIDIKFRSSGLETLKDLELRNCWFTSADKDFDFFSGLPCLENLMLDDVHSNGENDTSKIFRIAGLRLSTLEILSNQFLKIAINAPNLKSFVFHNCNRIVEFTELDLSSLDHADVMITQERLVYYDPFVWLETLVLVKDDKEDEDEDEEEEVDEVMDYLTRGSNMNLVRAMEEKSCSHLEKAMNQWCSIGSKPKPTMSCDLPEDILYHILPFLDTKTAVQTSVLSRGWRYVWKHVPVLNLDRDSFSVRSNFLTYVDKVFALHSQVRLDKFRFEDKGSHVRAYCKIIIQYAISHDTRHLAIGLSSRTSFQHVFGSRSTPWSSNLETLELRRMHLNFTHLCFPNVTNLKLDNCKFHRDINHLSVDLSVNFPCLVNLEICDSMYDYTYRHTVIAPQLLNLKLMGLPWVGMVAPRLESFILQSVSNKTYDDMRVPIFTLTYVDRAQVLVEGDDFDKVNLNMLLQGLVNAKSVVLRCLTKKLYKIVRKFLELNLKFFNRLESLVCVSIDPPKVVKYLVEGSAKPGATYKRSP
ncbi:Putative F-box/FBD/LRR-repeat protein At1g66300 [Linum perenne]